MPAIRYRPVRLGESPCTLETDESGIAHVQPRKTLGTYPERLLDRLIEGATSHPDRTLVARRENGGAWREVSYAQMLQQVRAIAQALSTRDLSVDRPLLILSGNSIEHLSMAFAAMWTGIPHCPLSPAASLRSADYGKVHHAMTLLTPGMVFADDLDAFAPAIAATVPDDVEVVGVTGTLDSHAVSDYASLAATLATSAVDDLHAATGPDTIAKFLFTSGSTSLPKAVITTQRMLCSNQQMLLETFPFLADEPPVLVDWLPWNHTFGGSHNIGIALYNGGSLYINEGRPTPELFGETVRNLKDVSPTLYLDVPRGWEELADSLEKDAELRRSFYARLKLQFFAAAGLSQQTWNRLDALAEQECGERIRVMAGLGCTETAPSSMFTTVPEIRAGTVGLPCPGCTLKLVPADDRLEARFAGPHVTPGYWREPERTASAFDAEGFYCSGDALDFMVADDLSYGFVFDGRISENFKLSSGSFVNMGAIRTRILEATKPYVQDVVITGAQRNTVGALVFVAPTACRKLADAGHDTPVETLLDDPALQAHFSAWFKQINQSATGSATHIAQACLVGEPPSFDVGEITDKGSINQRRVLEHRAELVDALHAGTAAHMIATD
ncbi:feruloyl-CoA synthase [Salinisphaera dokdonensis CL-ES53]|uniref:Feruloyl-CoA synthase n=1 Tax=Salinisphaera dokdonensis CL-ES53 TaxID=1304272 RepID=A0ABV2B0Y5_9GAMM